MPEECVAIETPPVREAVPAGPMKQLRWRLNRLRCMSPAEIPHRVLRSLVSRAESLGLRAHRTPLPDVRSSSRPWIQWMPRVDPARYLEAADRICAGRLDVFTLRNVDLGSPPRWNRDPKTGVEAPLQAGKLIDYRDSRLVGDIKYLWEPNRHQHLVTLAQAYAMSSGLRYFNTIRSHLESWFESCPCPRGPNWTSALEPAIRLINWSVVWQLFGGAQSPLFESDAGLRFRARWLESVHQHVSFIRGYLSLYSSANNHLVGEAAGIFIAALTWPFWPEADRWRDQAAAILQREALTQNGADGVNREQAVSYQQFELELLTCALLAGRANGHRFSAAFETRLEAMIQYLASIMDGGGHVPMFGDSDDAVVLNLSQQPDFCRFRSILATGAVLFRRADFKVKARKLDDRTRWLLGRGADVAFDLLSTAHVQLPARRAFPNGGYYILGCDFETDAEIRLIADAGPLGYQAIAAHGHADALSFTLSVGGTEIFVDTGTYAYHGQSEWRQYFRGTSAHNTLRIDGLDQSEPGGAFMWLRKARAGCREWSSSAALDVFEGWHDGYLRLRDPVLHRRRIVLDKALRRITIEDRVEMSGTHEVELFFHLNETCRAVALPDGFVITHGPRALHLKLPEATGAVAEIHCGSVKPPLGWISRRFGDKCPTPAIAWRASVAGHALLRTEITC